MYQQAVAQFCIGRRLIIGAMILFYIEGDNSYSAADPALPHSDFPQKETEHT